MKITTKVVLIIISSIMTVTSNAQSLPAYADPLNMKHDHYEGFIPRDTEQLVGAATIIVRGRFGGLVSHSKFYGYGNTKETFQIRHNIPDDVIDFVGLPLSEYEIIIDEILKGDILGDSIIYRVYESNPASGESLTEMQSVERLFFLTVNSDNETYSHLGARFILDNLNGQYSYKLPTPDPEEVIFRQIEFVSTSDILLFEEVIKDEISKQSSF